MQKPAVTVMVKAARLAGNVLLRSINKLDALNVVQKDRMDYASEVDADAEKVIVKELRRAYPDYAVVGEEGGIQGQSRYTWVIDPLDGTSNYLRGFPHYCVSIALVENGEPTDAVIFDPLRNDLFTASRGAGAQLNERKIRVADRKDLAGTVISTGFPPRERARAGAQLECVRELLVQAEDVRRTGSAALDLAYVACGRLDAYFEAGVKDWDIAAGVLLVREAGGAATDLDGGSRYFEGGNVVAGGRGTQAALLAAVGRCTSEAAVEAADPRPIPAAAGAGARGKPARRARALRRRPAPGAWRSRSTPATSAGASVTTSCRAPT